MKLRFSFQNRLNWIGMTSFRTAMRLYSESSMAVIALFSTESSNGFRSSRIPRTTGTSELREEMIPISGYGFSASRSKTASSGCMTRSHTPRFTASMHSVTVS